MSPYSLFHELLFLSMLPPETRIRNRHGKTDPFSTDTNTIANNALHIKNLAMHTKIKRKSVERLKKSTPSPPTPNRIIRLFLHWLQVFPASSQDGIHKELCLKIPLRSSSKGFRRGDKHEDCYASKLFVLQRWFSVDIQKKRWREN